MKIFFVCRLLNLIYKEKGCVLECYGYIIEFRLYIIMLNLLND